MRGPTNIVLPKITSFALHGFTSLFSQDLSMSINAGPNIVLGGNGLGKTTVVQAVVYGLTGGIGDHIEPNRSLRWNHRYFKGRLTSDEIAHATVTVTFELGRGRFTVVRGLQNSEVLEFKQDGKRRQAAAPGAFSNALNQYGGYGSVDDFSFVVHRLLYLPESRRLLAWDTDAQVRLLMLLNQDSTTENNFRDLRADLKLMDSKKRHIHVAIGKAEQNLASLMDYEETPDDLDEQEDGDAENQDQALTLPIVPPVDLNKLGTQLQELVRIRAGIESDVRNQELELSNVSTLVEGLQDQIDAAEASLINSLLTEAERSNSLALHRLVENGECPACGTRQLDLQEIARRHARSACCVICGSESPQQEVHSLATLRSQLSEKLSAQRAVQNLLRTTRAQLVEIERREWEMRSQYTVASNAEPSLSLIEQNIPTSTREQLEAEKARLERAHTELEVTIQQLQEKLERDFRDFRLAVDQRIETLRQLYAGYATAFLGLECRLSDLTGADRLLKLSSFVPEFAGTRRDTPEACSEAQRFFLDIAFRMSLIDLAAQLTGQPSTFVCETPETALDVSYIDNVVKMFTNFANKDQCLLLTANIQPEGIAGKLLAVVPKRSRTSRILNLLEVGHLSAVQMAARTKLRRLVKKTIES